MADAGIARYYDRLNRWNETARLVGYGGGRERLTVHRALADPAADGAATTTRLHDLLLSVLPPRTAPRVLDAGCGLGGTMLMLAERLGADVTGVTLSESQARTARHAIHDAGLDARVRVHVQSYDTPPPGPFDVVIALESLAHSPSPGASVTALVSTLAPAGTLVIVDDMPQAEAGDDPDLARFKHGWRSPVVWRADQYVAHLTALGLTVVEQRDLSGDVRPRPVWRIGVLEALNRLAALWPSAALREVMDSHMGGLALERLSRRGLMRYRLLVARRPAAPLS